MANAGLLPMAMGAPDPMDFVDATDVDLIGVMNAVAVVPHLPNFGSVVVTGSTAAMLPDTTDNPAMGPGSAGCGWAKRILMSYVEQIRDRAADPRRRRFAAEVPAGTRQLSLPQRRVAANSASRSSSRRASASGRVSRFSVTSSTPASA